LAESPMKIICPSCQTSYDVSAASLGDGGRQVRCVRCRNVWFATAEPEPAEVAASDADAVSAAASVYGRVAEPPPPAGSAADDQAGDDSSFEVDPNLAARAADRSARMSDDADAAADWDTALAAHDSPPLAPDSGGAAAAQGHGAQGPGAHGSAADIESYAARRARRAPGKHSGGAPRRRSLAIVIAPLLLINGALVLWRSDVVRAMPQTARLFSAIGLGVNLRGIALNDVSSTRETNDNVSILVVQGMITNISRQQLDIPRVRFALRNAGGAEVYTWTSLPERPTLAPGESEPFQTRLASPPAEGRDVMVRLFNRRDAAPGLR
jgi:predicted Zn finger-like uncharacterized protein